MINNKNERKYYVYEWFIKDTGEVFYVGKGCRERWRTRKRENRFFMSMLEKHDCDVRKIKENLTEEEAFALEIEMIKYYREKTNFRLTNILDGGEAPPRMIGNSSPTKREDVRRKIGDSNRKRYIENPELRKIQSERLKVFLMTEKGKEFRRKALACRDEQMLERIRINMTKTMRTSEFREKHSVIMKKAYSKEEVREKVRGSNNGASRRVSQYTLDGVFIAEYATLREADEKTGISFKEISKVVRGHRKMAGGYIWKFSDNKNIEYKPRRTYNENIIRNRKAIAMYDLKGNLIKTYSSIAKATDDNNFKNHSNIICNLKGKTKTAYGYIWRYLE